MNLLHELEVAGGRTVERLGRDGERARDFARDSLSPASRRAYQTDVEVFMQWCRERGVRPLPAEPEVVAAFLAHEAERGLRTSTVARRASGIRLLHRTAGYETPTTSEIVRTTLKGIRRSLGVAPQQKAPATADVVLDMVKHVPENLRGLRDRALLLFWSYLGSVDSGRFREQDLRIEGVATSESVQERDLARPHRRRPGSRRRRDLAAAAFGGQKSGPRWFGDSLRDPT